MDFKLETFLPYRINQAAERVSQRFAAQYRSRYQMTRPEWRAAPPARAPRPPAATRTCAASRVHKTKATPAVRALEDKRWLKRSEDASDRRVEHLELTPAGKRIYGEMIELARAYERDMARLLADGLQQLEAGLAAIEATLPAEPARRGPKD